MADPFDTAEKIRSIAFRCDQAESIFDLATDFTVRIPIGLERFTVGGTFNPIM
jgi:hypothetical protein